MAVYMGLRYKLRKMKSSMNSNKHTFTKPTIWHMYSFETQICVGIHPVCSEVLFCCLHRERGGVQLQTRVGLTNFLPKPILWKIKGGGGGVGTPVPTHEHEQSLNGHMNG